MTNKLDSAIAVLNAVVSQSNQWGKHYSLINDSERSGEDILKAIKIVMANAKFHTKDLEEENLKLSKQLRAAKAREGKLKKQTDQLKRDVKGLSEQVAELTISGGE